MIGVFSAPLPSIQDRVRSLLGLQEASLDQSWAAVEELYLESTFDTVSCSIVPSYQDSM